MSADRTVNEWRPSDELKDRVARELGDAWMYRAERVILAVLGPDPIATLEAEGLLHRVGMGRDPEDGNAKSDEWELLPGATGEETRGWQYVFARVPVSESSGVVPSGDGSTTDDVSENTRRNMEKHNIPRGVGLPERPPPSGDGSTK